MTNQNNETEQPFVLELRQYLKNTRGLLHFPSTAIRVAQIVIQERRTSVRKPLHCHIVIGLSDNTTLKGRTLDLSPAGVRITVARSLITPQECTFEFTMLVDGRPQTIGGCGRLLSCVCSGMEGFSIGMRFTQIDEPGQAIIDRFLG